MKYLPWKHLPSDKGFTLLEILIVFSFFLFFLIMVMQLLSSISQAVEVHAHLIEKNETIFEAVDQFKMLAKHGRHLMLTQNSYRLRVVIGTNIVEAYPKESSFLLKHLQAANPILEHCRLQEAPFVLNKSEEGKIELTIVLDFLFPDDSEEHLVLSFVSWCQEVES